MNETQFIDGKKVAALRLLAGLSQRALARILAVSPGAVRRIEDGGDPGDFTLRFFGRLAAALGVDPVELLASPSAVRPAEDDVVVEAALADLGRYAPIEDLARALGWRLERVHSALEALDQRLGATGMLLKRKNLEYALGVRRAVLADEQQVELDRVALQRWGLHGQTARVLRTALDGSITRTWEQDATAWKLLALGTLLKNRILRFDEERVLVTPDVAFSLELTPQR